MKYIKTEIPEVVIIQPQLFNDDRGYFYESFSQNKFEENIIKTTFIQDNESKSTYGVLRGLHYQLPPFAQAKLVRVLQGKILDIAVDIRKGSPTYGKHVKVELTSDNKKQLFVPRGFAHGFVVLSETAEVAYKIDNIYAPKHEASIRFDDSILNIDWGLDNKDVILSDKDKIAPLLKDASLFDYNMNLYQ